MTQIIGFHGKKQSGKNTSCNFICMLKLLEHGISKSARLNDQGEIEVTDILGEKVKNKDWFLFKEPLVNTSAVMHDMLNIKIYGFANYLKDMCVDLFNIDKDKAYGTDKDKEELTDLLWQNMPGVVTNQRDYASIRSKYPNVKNNIFYHKKGYMSIREVLQFVGTEIFRSMYGDIWARTLLNIIKKENYKMALICDVRFDNEIKKIKQENGIVIGLTKNNKDRIEHISEQLSLKLCDEVIDNENLDIPSQNKAIYQTLRNMNVHIPELSMN